MWLSTNEIQRLAERLDRANNAELEGLSHYFTEPAAKRLARSHPAIAARIHRALCMRILDAGKSKYYYAALANLEEARRCYLAAGLDDQWKTLVYRNSLGPSPQIRFYAGPRRDYRGQEGAY